MLSRSCHRLGPERAGWRARRTPLAAVLLILGPAAVAEPALEDIAAAPLARDDGPAVEVVTDGESDPDPDMTAPDPRAGADGQVPDGEVPDGDGGDGLAPPEVSMPEGSVSAVDVYQVALQAYHHGYLPEALEAGQLFLDHFAQHPLGSKVHYMMAEIHRRDGDLAAAQAALEAGLAAFPAGSAAAWTALGLAQLQQRQGDPAAACAGYRALLVRRPAAPGTVLKAAHQALAELPC